MSSSSSEYLRRKLQRLPVTYGPATYGDASQRTAVIRYQNSKPPHPTLTKSTKPSCCSGVPSGGPYNSRNGDGQQQQWSLDGLIASRVHCSPLAPGFTVAGCCDPERDADRVAGIHYDASGIPVTAAYRGKKSPCCEFNATLASIAAIEDRCSCALNPATRLNTLLANDMPRDPIPFHPAMKDCCVHPTELCTCCGADGITHFCNLGGVKY